MAETERVVWEVLGEAGIERLEEEHGLLGAPFDPEDEVAARAVEEFVEIVLSADASGIVLQVSSEDEANRHFYQSLAPLGVEEPPVGAGINISDRYVLDITIGMPDEPIVPDTPRAHDFLSTTGKALASLKQKLGGIHMPLYYTGNFVAMRRRLEQEHAINRSESIVLFVTRKVA
ncbi:MAG: hypothetical protein HYT49_02530 [Candidatus Wildermuthbacteria bacterium]|nr:hypothetical protein [Candidatus Wildermuthbacteria bacterium]